MEQLLYHYCSTQKMFAIMSGKKLRMSDITKSNDYNEVSMFFPGIMDAIIDMYIKHPFSFEYASKKNECAIGMVLQFAYNYFCEKFQKGGVTNFVVCFCEEGDKLSQWRGYADNGRGCSIGFSKMELMEYANKYTNFMTLKKVEYKNVEEINDIIISSAIKILDELKDLRKFLTEQLNCDNDRIEELMLVIFIEMLNVEFMQSLKYKDSSYYEENEWRLFFKYPIDKRMEVVYGKMKNIALIEEMVEKLNGRIDFNVADDDIIPFFPIDLFEISDTPVKEVIMGPKNKILNDDFKLLCGKYDYSEVNYKISKIAYR